MHITVNGTRHDVSQGEIISYETIAAMAGKPDDKFLTVTYRAPPVGDVQRSGILMPGAIMAVADGMIFNAIRTGNA